MVVDTSPLPPVDVSSLPVADRVQAGEEAAFDHSGKVLDRNLRGTAGYGALGVSAVLYTCGLFLAFEFAKPGALGVPTAPWQVVAASLAALFTVPTVLVLAVLRSSSAKSKDSEADSLHAAIGTKVMALIDKVIDGVVKP